MQFEEPEPGIAGHFVRERFSSREPVPTSPETAPFRAS
jgi:hypothetical protein